MSKIVISSVVNRTRTFHIKKDSKEFQNLWREYTTTDVDGNPMEGFHLWDEDEKESCWTEFLGELVNGDLVTIDDESNNPYYTMEVEEDCDYADWDYPSLDTANAA